MAESVNTESTPIESDDSLNIKDILYQCLAKWYWFVISLAICVGYTYWNLLKQPDVYTRTAKVQTVLLRRVQHESLQLRQQPSG